MDLPSVKNDGPALITAPKSSVSEADYMNLGKAISGTADAVEGMLYEAGKPMAEAQAKRDAASMISRDENGTITLQDRPHPLIVGPLGDVYTKTALTAFHIGITDALQTKGQELAALTNKPTAEGGGGGDPNWFRQQMDPVVKGIASQVRGGSQDEVLQVGQQIAGEYYRHLVGQRAAMDGQAAKNTFDARIGMLQTDLADLASQGGAETDAFKAKAEALDTLRRQKLADPRMLYTQAQYEDDTRSDRTNWDVQQVIGIARRQAEESGDYFSPVRRAEDLLQKIPMDPWKRVQLLGEITRHIGSAAAVRGQQLKELNDDADGMAKAIYDTHSADDNATNDMIARLVAAKAWGAATRLQAAREFIKIEPILLNGTADQVASTFNSVMNAAKGTPAGDALPRVAGKVFATGYSPQIKGDQVEGDYRSSVPGPDGQALVRTLEDVRQGRSAYVTIAGNPAFYGRKYTIPEVTYQANGKSYTLKNVPAVVHDTGEAFDGSKPGRWGPATPEGRFDVAIGRDLDMNERNQSMAAVRFVPAGSAGGSPVAPNGVGNGFREIVPRMQGVVNQNVERLWSGMKSAWDAGNLPSAQEVSDLKSLLPLYSQAEGRKEIALRLQVEASTDKVTAYPGPVRDDLAAAAKIAAQTGQLDAVGRATEARIQQAVKTKDDMLRSNPVGYTATYLQGKDGAGVPALDLSTPDGLRGSLTERQKMAGTARAAEPTAGFNPLTPTDRQQIADALPKMTGGAAGAVLSTLTGTLKPEEMQAVMGDDGIRSAVVGLTKSGDPAKMAAGFGFLDAQNRRNPMQFAATFGEDAERALHVWQAKSQFQPPEVVAKQMMTANDPSSIKARQELEKGADDLLKGTVGDDVVKKLAAHPWFTWVPGDQSVFGFNPGAPMSSGPAMSSAELLADYRQAFRDGYAETGDRRAAETFAVKQTLKKWGPSPTNGGRLMAYPPERYVQPVNGDHAWMGKQLDEDIRSALGVKEHYAAEDPWAQTGRLPTTDAEAKAVELYTAPRALVADAQTVADIEAGKVPSYRVVVRDREGLLHLMEEKPGTALRWRPDRSAAVSAAEAGFRAGHEATQDREAWFSGGGNGQVGNALFGAVMGGGM